MQDLVDPPAAAASPEREVAPRMGGSRLATGTRAALSTGDFVLRLAYFLVSPVLVLAIAIVIPITGILINVGLAIAVYFLANRVREVAVLKKALGRALQFEAYYREHPPKPFLYYVFFPLLFPYWLIVPTARRELFAYKSFTGMSLVILLAFASYRFFAYWRPEIPIQSFLIFAAITILFQLAVAMLILMPLATSVVTYHSGGKRGRLALLVAASLLSFGVTIHHHATHPPIVHPLEIEYRARLRTKIAGPRAAAILERAAKAAVAEIVVDQKIPDTLRDLWIEGFPAEVAREKLAGLYKSDECDDFRLSIVKTTHGHDAVLLFQARSANAAPRVWIAVDATGEKLPDDAISQAELVNAQLGRRPQKQPKHSK